MFFFTVGIINSLRKWFSIWIVRPRIRAYSPYFSGAVWDSWFRLFIFRCTYSGSRPYGLFRRIANERKQCSSAHMWRGTVEEGAGCTAPCTRYKARARTRKGPKEPLARVFSLRQRMEILLFFRPYCIATLDWLEHAALGPCRKATELIYRGSVVKESGPISSLSYEHVCMPRRGGGVCTPWL